MTQDGRRLKGADVEPVCQTACPSGNVESVARYGCANSCETFFGPPFHLRKSAESADPENLRSGWFLDPGCLSLQAVPKMRT